MDVTYNGNEHTCCHCNTRCVTSPPASTLDPTGRMT